MCVWKEVQTNILQTRREQWQPWDTNNTFLQYTLCQKNQTHFMKWCTGSISLYIYWSVMHIYLKVNLSCSKLNWSLLCCLTTFCCPHSALHWDLKQWFKRRNNLFEPVSFDKMNDIGMYRDCRIHYFILEKL